MNNQLANGIETRTEPVLPVCKTCKGKKKVPKRDWYNGNLIGSIKCWDCNGGIRPSTMFDNY